jgi:hypothetical protein
MGCGGDSASSAGGSAGASVSAGQSAVTAAGAGAGTGAGAASPAVPAATFSEVYPMIFPMSTNARCVACHSMPPNDLANGNLQMGSDRASAYAALVSKNSTSTRCMNMPLVMPGQPDQSLLLLKLSPTPPCGNRMPIGGNALSDDQLGLIRSWIAGGAKDD